MMSYILVNAWDPRKCNVVMYSNRYQDHIARRHGHIMPDHILDTLEDPDIITQDLKDDLGENYYKRGAVDNHQKYILKVVVTSSGDNGKVKTAYEVIKPNPKEIVIWPKD